MTAGASVEARLRGRVTTKVLANLRQGAPSTDAAVIRKLPAGEVLTVSALAIGDNLEGNAHWYRVSAEGYLWAGACGEPVADAAAPPPSEAEAAVLAALARTPLVVDLSHGDGVESFEKARAAGVVGIIHKATTGATGRDDHYRQRRQQARAAGLLWGAYHWGTAANVEAQLENFFTWAQPDPRTTLVALDFERDTGDQMSLEQARVFLQGVIDRLRRKAVIYSGATLKDGLGVRSDPYFGAHRLWLAQYDAHPAPQKSWGDGYWLWQHTDGATGPGIKTVPGLPGDRAGRLDGNHFPGTAAELAAQWAV